jgi:hypothetical protein
MNRPTKRRLERSSAMGIRDRSGRTDLFLLRVWAEDVHGRNGEVAWRGKVQRVADGETHLFSDWQGLVALLLAMLSKKEGR